MRIRVFTSTKIRGQHKFKDTFNQFSSLQDSEGFVTWTYEHGPLLDEELFQKVDVILEKLKTHYVREKKEGGYYLLSGLLKASDGTPFHGVSAKSGQNRYYYNKASKKRIPCHVIDTIVCDRVKQYLLDSNILESAFAVSMKNSTSDKSPLQSRVGQLKKEIDKLVATLKGFSDTLRATALSDSKNLLEVTKIISAEKAKVEAELESLKGLLVEGEQKLKASHLDKSPKLVSDYLKIAMRKFDSEEGIKKRRIIEAVIPEIEVVGDKELILKINPMPTSNLCDSGCKNVVLDTKWRSERLSNRTSLSSIVSPRHC